MSCIGVVRKRPANISNSKSWQFSINLTPPCVSDNSTSFLQRWEVKLDEEWTMTCLCIGIQQQKPQSVEIRRQSKRYGVRVSGSLYLVRNQPDGETLTRVGNERIGDEKLAEKKFSEFMAFGCSSTVVEFKDTTSGFSSEIYTLKGVVNITSSFDLFVTMKDLEVLSNDLGRLLDPETCCCSDVNLKCGGVSIPAHKSILSARSPVFAAMFKNPMNESLENEVVIEDVDLSVLRMMLVFVYKGQLSDLTVTSALHLLEAAHKYLIEDLQTMCRDFLKENVSIQNGLGIL